MQNLSNTKLENSIFNLLNEVEDQKKDLFLNQFLLLQLQSLESIKTILEQIIWNGYCDSGNYLTINNHLESLNSLNWQNPKYLQEFLDTVYLSSDFDLETLNILHKSATVKMMYFWLNSVIDLLKKQTATI